MENIKDFIVERKFLFLCGFLTLLCLLMGGLYLKNASAEEAFHCPVDTLDTDEEIETLGDFDYVRVDIKGAVRNPGVYDLEEGSVVNDLIKVAGGLMSDADTSTLNLSKKLTNEMVIYVYTKSQLKEKQQSDILGDATIKNEVDANESIIGGSSSSSKDNVLTGKVNLNTASKDELILLPGIGEAKADSIISYRKTCGAFTKIEDIKNITGVGDKLYEQIKDYITV